jgi:iron-sulfur cluster insertion protein
MSELANAHATESESTIELTPKAVEMVREVRAKEGFSDNHALRVSVVGGGCSGFSYQLTFDDQVQDGDSVSEYEGVRVLVDATSAQYLVGTQIDFVSSLHGGGFKFSNPKATHTCGCGSSFNA